jgi:hypothetical protein
VGAEVLLPPSLTLVFWNPRGISNKEVVFKHFLDQKGAVYAGVAESQTYRSATELSDGRWRWDGGTEGKPSEKGGAPSRGMGVFVDVTKAEGSLVRQGKYTLWHRIELEGEGGALICGVGYFPDSQDVKGHSAANKELSEALAFFNCNGDMVVFGGDLNAHTGANGDLTPPDKAGEMMLETARLADMVVINTLEGLCSGGPSRVQVRVDGVQESTLDYVMCSTTMVGHIDHLVIDDGQMDSDHRPLVLKTRGLLLRRPVPASRREVWDVRDIPSPPDDWSWVHACRGQFEEWIEMTGDVVAAATAAGLDDARMGDVLEWSFQRALDGVAAERLGTRFVGPTPTPLLDAASRLLIQQREVCREVMERLSRQQGVPATAKAAARSRFLAAGARVRAGAARRKQMKELELFRDVEEKQGDSKLFWGKFKLLRNSIHVAKSPPPVAVDAEGKTVTDPVEVLRAWRDFSAGIASADLNGTKEEGIYDDEYKREVEERLEWMRSMRQHQPVLDGPITAMEVFAAIRTLKMGKAPGVDGVLTDILKTAADAVNNSKLRGANTVVDALVLLFNFVFDKEVWPERWGTGIIFPLHKHDSRLDPSNYRPITLLSVVGKLFGVIVNARLSAFSEATGSLSDEQGGFRPKRGTPDQVFLLREVLASRKERGLPTLATYIDARKAYDTVWREDAYVRIHESGVRGKLWRQLQVMHSGLTRRVMHPLGMTDWFKVERGVAQGAVESPWVYANFIDGLAKALKARGLGVVIAGRRIPLLMYADDIVMLAATQRELMLMNKVASHFARQHRFQFNGKKSGVMLFNVKSGAKAVAKSADWTLFGEKVEVEDSYVYLGTITQSDGLSWTAHLKSAIEKARRRSADLLWVCRADRGMRPRTAITLWQSLVRPLLEYASELWSGQVPAELVREAESVQCTFLRGTLGLHANGSGVADDALRAEAGCELLEDRWAKLKLGYWRRLFSAKPDRLLRVVAAFRHQENVRSEGRGFGSKGWMRTVRLALTKVGLAEYFGDTRRAAREIPDAWKDRVYCAVEVGSDADRVERMTGMSSVQVYNRIKEWGVNTGQYSFSAGEDGRPGRLVPERYLDDRVSLKGTRLKLLCRLNCLPVMDRVGREVKPKWPKPNRVCFACGSGKVEDVHHFVMDCPRYARKRAALVAHVGSIVSGSALGAQAPAFANMSSQGQLEVILGKRIGDPIAENRIDTAVKKYLIKTWNSRTGVTAAINATLGTNYDVCSLAAKAS